MTQELIDRINAQTLKEIEETDWPKVISKLEKLKSDLQPGAAQINLTAQRQHRE